MKHPRDRGEQPTCSKCDVLGLPRGATADDVNRAYRDKARSAHPDAGGSTETMAALNRARDDALRATTNHHDDWRP